MPLETPSSGRGKPKVDPGLQSRQRAVLFLQQQTPRNKYDIQPETSHTIKMFKLGICNKLTVPIAHRKHGNQSVLSGD